MDVPLQEPSQAKSGCWSSGFLEAAPVRFRRRGRRPNQPTGPQTAHLLLEVEVPLGDALPDGVNVFETDCSVDRADVAPETDVDAIVNGFATETLVPADL